MVLACKHYHFDNTSFQVFHFGLSSLGILSLGLYCFLLTYRALKEWIMVSAICVNLRQLACINILCISLCKIIYGMPSYITLFINVILCFERKSKPVWQYYFVFFAFKNFSVKGILRRKVTDF